MEPPLLLLPPPQPAPAAKNTSSISPSPPRRRRRSSGTPRKKIPANNAPLLAASQPQPRPDPGDFNAPERLVPDVVCTVNVEVPEPLATGFEPNVHDGAGLPPPVTVQASVTEPVKPPLGLMVTVEVADPPAATVAGVSAGAAIVKPGDDTVKLMDVLWTVAPEVPVTVMLEVPSGVFELVVMVSVDVPEAVREPGEKLQAAPTGRLACMQVRLTVPLNPFSIETVMVEVPDCPGAGTVTGLPPIEKSGAIAKVGHEVTSTFALIDPRPVTRS